MSIRVGKKVHIPNNTPFGSEAFYVAEHTSPNVILVGKENGRVKVISEADYEYYTSYSTLDKICIWIMLLGFGWLAVGTLLTQFSWWK